MLQCPLIIFRISLQLAPCIENEQITGFSGTKDERFLWLYALSFSALQSMLSWSTINTPKYAGLNDRSSILQIQSKRCVFCRPNSIANFILFAVVEPTLDWFQLSNPVPYLVSTHMGEVFEAIPVTGASSEFGYVTLVPGSMMSHAPNGVLSISSRYGLSGSSADVAHVQDDSVESLPSDYTQAPIHPSSYGDHPGVTDFRQVCSLVSHIHTTKVFICHLTKFARVRFYSVHIRSVFGLTRSGVLVDVSSVHCTYSYPTP